MEYSYRKIVLKGRILYGFLIFNSIQTTIFLEYIFKMKQTIFCDGIILKSYPKLFLLTYYNVFKIK